MKNFKEKFKTFIKQRDMRSVTEAGFSLLELVVAVGILLVLTVGGLIAYSGITANSRQAAVDQDASVLYTGVMSSQSGGNDEDVIKIVSQFAKSGGYTINQPTEAAIGMTEIIYTNEDGTRTIDVRVGDGTTNGDEEYSTTSTGVDVKVSATYGDKTYTSSKGEFTTITNTAP